MKTLQDFKSQLGTSVEHVSEGWSRLWHQAKDAMIRFKPTKESHHPSTMNPFSGSGWGFLATNVHEDDKQVYVNIEVPGMRVEDLEIAIEGDTLVVSGHKQHRAEDRFNEYYLLECAYGQFQRQIPLPQAVDETKAQASYQHGVLRISLPKRNPQQPLKIDVH